ncbi:hypothetical protein L596_004177 [Steinernema carpocapsae]|uniref:Uncharacterized protein n=1 Tax=Steinernema carpocapsae TaxID=34508 RepID=A0A4U8UWM3_STECR|nr:hypothetical protein L596_004177 [Steinernema carpocapsae]
MHVSKISEHWPAFVYIKDIQKYHKYEDIDQFMDVEREKPSVLDESEPLNQLRESFPLFRKITIPETEPQRPKQGAERNSGNKRFSKLGNKFNVHIAVYYQQRLGRSIEGHFVP